MRELRGGNKQIHWKQLSTNQNNAKVNEIEHHGRYNILNKVDILVNEVNKRFTLVLRRKESNCI